MANGNKDIAYEKVTQTIIESLEKGIVPWKKPWNVIGANMPKNLLSEKVYNGINLLVLGSAGKASPVWGTYKQWTEKFDGCHPQKGESYPILFWNSYALKDRKTGEPILDERGKQKRFGFYKYFNVWNAENVDGIELADFVPTVDENGATFDVIEAAESIVGNMPKCPPIQHGGDIASYSPSIDIVKMPKKEQFHNNHEYYSTLFHELSHSTGHQTRVGRDLKGWFGDKDYSIEELIAEISACFLCSSIGIDQTFDNSTAYIKGWLSKLKDDKKMIVQAASKARYSAEFILDIQKDETETETETERETETV